MRARARTEASRTESRQLQYANSSTRTSRSRARNLRLAHPLAHPIEIEFMYRRASWPSQITHAHTRVRGQHLMAAPDEAAAAAASLMGRRREISELSGAGPDLAGSN